MDICPFSKSPCYHKKCIHITEVGKDYKAESTSDMCILCGLPYISSNNGEELPPFDMIFDLIDSIIKDKAVSEATFTLPQVRSCKCGWTLRDIVASGKLGCGDCYNTFKEEVKTVIQSCQGATQHVGKMPSNKSLEEQLAEAIKKEEYEKAAEIKVKLDKLK